METQKSIENQILTYLLADTELATLLGNSNIRVDTLTRSDTFPYIRFDIDSRAKDAGDTPVMRGVLTVDIWDKNVLGTQKVSDISERLVQLLSFKTFSNQEKAKGIRIFFESFQRVADTEEFIYHIVLLFSVEYIRTNIINVL
jgi:hypothetical protein